MGRVVILLSKLTHEAKSQTWMFILCLFEAVFISRVVSLEKKGLECKECHWKSSFLFDVLNLYCVKIYKCNVD